MSSRPVSRRTKKLFTFVTVLSMLALALIAVFRSRSTRKPVNVAVVGKGFRVSNCPATNS